MKIGSHIFKKSDIEIAPISIEAMIDALCNPQISLGFLIEVKSYIRNKNLETFFRERAHVKKWNSFGNFLWDFHCFVQKCRERMFFLQ